jgi:hypothetical protein
LNELSQHELSNNFNIIEDADLNFSGWRKLASDMMRAELKFPALACDLALL